MEETPRDWERKVSGVSMLAANVLLAALSLFLVSQRRWKCFCKVKYVHILSCFKITGQTIMINIAGKTNQYPQFFDRLATTFVVSREDKFHGNDGILRRINIFHLFT